MASVKRVEKEKNIQVVVRCRPYNNLERKAACHGVIDCDQNRREVSVKTGGVNDKAKKTYTFDMVFGPAAKQIEVYRSVVYPILDEVIMGYNCTVFAYGQTGTGKTFTMEGERSPEGEFTWEDDPLAGIIPRTLHQIFEKLTTNGTEFSVKVSLLEIYNEELFDLLSTKPDNEERLQLFDDPRNKRGVIVKNLEEITVHNKDEVYQILERGAAKRKTASTLLNAYSSRSHSVFSVTIHMKEITMDGEELVKIGKLNLVDLAGSESIGRSGAVDKRAREAGNINQSLLTLGRVITALVEKRPHIPYRESKLTRILQDSLGGHTKTSIIATVSPASINMEESVSTLDYANRAKSILNKPEVNQKLTKRTLIKEYTEEIERLKRDLAATRDKNGVYLSAADYGSITGQVTSQEEQITEYTERIAAVEEELRKMTELFVDHKTQLERCSSELEEKSQALQETQVDLQQTQVKLTQEAFICTELTNTQEQLYNTAGKLLSTAECSTSDVSGLHAKLDRKNQVEQHNSQIQSGFSQRMGSMFGLMHSSLLDQASRSQGMLDHYSASVESLQAANDETFKGAVGTVASCLGGVRELVAEGVAKVQAKMAEQESACLQSRESLQQVLEEHKEVLEEVLLAQVLPGLSAVQELNDTLKRSLEGQRAVANQVEAMREQMSAFFLGHAQDLVSLREVTAQGLDAMTTQQTSLKDQISQLTNKHQTGISQVIQCLSDQLNLLALDTQSDCSGLMSSADALQGPVQSMHNTLTSRCSAAERHVAAQRDQLSSAATSLVSQLQQNAQATQQTVEESAGYVSHLHGSVGGLAERSLLWCSSTRDQNQSQAQDQLSLLKDNIASTHSLLQGVEQGCDAHLQEARGQLEQQRGEVTRVQGAMREQISSDRTTLEDHWREMQTHIDSGLACVQTFLSEDLRQDAPTGTTPQRKEYVYPRVLTRARNRAELLDSLRHQQGELEAAMNADTVTEEVEEEEAVEVEQPQLDQDSLEDELLNDSSASQQSSVDENLVCNERGPFFRKKKASRVGSKTVHRPKMAAETETPPRSRLPLRSQNI